MRINKFVAIATGMSRRSVDTAISDGRILVNGKKPTPGHKVLDSDLVVLDNSLVSQKPKTKTIILNKPVGYVCSRNGQGSKTIYELLPPELHQLKPVGRLDKDSSGLLLLTNDGDLAHKLTHPSFDKVKLYEVRLNKEITGGDLEKIDKGVALYDGVSRIKVVKLPKEMPSTTYRVKINEGRNRQIRRTFMTLGYEVFQLHRTEFGEYKLGNLGQGEHSVTTN